jgi:hypothetical protein
LRSANAKKEGDLGILLENDVTKFPTAESGFTQEAVVTDS